VAWPSISTFLVLKNEGNKVVSDCDSIWPAGHRMKEMPIVRPLNYRWARPVLFVAVQLVDAAIIAPVLEQGARKKRQIKKKKSPAWRKSL